MWKKILISVISLIGTFSIVYALDQDLFATVYSIPDGVYTGRIGPAGDNLNQPHFQKGDLVNTGIKDTNGNDITWLLLNNSSLWISGVNNEVYYEIPAQVAGTTNGMYALSYNEVSTTSFRDTVPSNPNQKYLFNTPDSTITPVYVQINTGIENSVIQKKYSLVHKKDPNLTWLGVDASYGNAFMNEDYARMPENIHKYTFPQTFNEISTGHHVNVLGPRYGDIPTIDKILRDGESYISGNIFVIGTEAGGLYINELGGYTAFPENGYLTKYPLRVPLLFNMSDVVFAVSNNKNTGLDTGYSNITNMKKLSSYTNLYNEAAAYQPMKLRIKNEPTHDVSFDALSSDKVLDKTVNLNQIYSGDKLEVRYTGKTNVTGKEYVSVLIQKQNTEGSYDFIYYSPLSDQTDDNVIIDTSKFPLGKYKVSIVNETITSDNEATYSSALKTKEFDIVNLHSIAYEAKPQSGASVEGTYEFSKNVKAGTKVGEITATKSAGRTLKYTMAPTNDDTKSYLNFDIAATSSAAKTDVLVKTNDLKAGTYKFCIVATDENNIPADPIDNSTKVCPTLVVNKILPTISFVETTQKDITIGAAVSSGTVTTSNPESPGITYALSDGIVDTLKVSKNATNPLQYDLQVEATHTGSGLPTTFNLSATVEETENYKAATTKTARKVFVYKALSGLTFTPIKSSFSASEVNASGIIVGDLTAIDGIGDYTYELVKSSDDSYDPSKGADNSSFTVSNTATSAGVKPEVKTAAALTPKTYNIQFKVTDSKNATFYTDATIKVNSISQSPLDFKDASGENSITTVGKKLKFNDTNVKLLAKGGNSSSAIEYDFAPDEMQEGLNPKEYATIHKSSGLITPLKTGKIKVQAKRPSDGIYDDAFVYMDVTIEPAEQVIVFKDTGVINIKEGLNKKVAAIGSIKSNGQTGIGSIVYSIDDTSIATVDSSTGDVTAVKAGTATITATMNKSGENGYNANYETVTATKSIKVYKGMSLEWNASSPKLKANANAIGNAVGTLSVSDNASDPDFAISTNTIAENIDAGFFQVVDNGTMAEIQLAKKISASDWDSHGGSFKVQVDVSDSNGVQSKNIIVVLDEADNDAYFTEGGKKITSLTKIYGENSNSFTLTSKTDGGGVTYNIASDPNSVLTISGKGNVKINKAGKATVEVVAGAGNGYAQKNVTMEVTVEKGIQNIAFKDTTTLNRAFNKDETFIEIAELKETSQNTESERNIVYTSNSPDVCDIDSITGLVTMITKGNCDISASNQDLNWSEISVNKVINLYDGMGVSFTPMAGLQAELTSTAAGAKAGSLSVNGGIDPKTYAISTVTGAKNKDAAYFQVNTSGIVSFKKAIMATDLEGKYNSTKKIYELYVQIETTDSLHTKVITDVVIELKGAPLKASFDTNGTGKITEEYGLNKTFTLDLSSNKGGGIPTYQLKDDATMPSDVLQSVDASGLVTILHANDKTFVGNPLKVEAIIPPSKGYDGETIETIVEITQGTQPDFAFVTPNIKLGYEASISPTFTGQLSSGTITMTSGNNAIATIVGNEIKAKSADGTVTITAIESGDRDYKRTTATASVTINSEPAYDFVMNVSSAVYGDSGLTAKIILNDAKGANQTQTWSSSDLSIAEIAQGTQNDESGEIIIHKAGTVTISCTQTSIGEPSVTATAVMVVEPKPITVQINNASKYVGEKVPAFSASIPTADLVGSDTLGQPAFSCKDGAALVKDDSKAGTYDINGTYPTNSHPNYAITVKKGALTVKQDASLPAWFHLEGVTSKTKLDGTTWVNEDVNVVLDTAIESAGTYDEMSLDKTLWGTSHSVTTEGVNNKNIDFRVKSSKAIATSQSTSFKIDKTKPVINSITGTPADRNDLEELLNSITFGKYFKPKLEVSVKAEDVLPKNVKENSGVKIIHYNVYQIQDDATIKDPIASGEMKSTDVLKLVDEGKYMVCATAEDVAGNVSDEKCSGIRIRDIGDDSDGDGIPDLNIDTNEDGKADLNITKNPEDKLPWMNIDTVGDGLPHMNIDQDGDNVPDLNTGIISEWTCDLNVDLDKDGKADYKTSSTLKGLNNIDTDQDKHPDINLDLKLTGLPTLNINTDGSFKKPQTNIDGDGDGVVDINIDENGDGKPDKNIVVISEWKPEINVKKDGKIIYDTMSIKYITKGELEDNGIVIKPSNPDSVFLPNYLLKVNDITKNLDDDTKKSIIEITGEHSEVKHVFDVSLSDGNSTIQPDGSIIVRIPVDEAIKNPKVLLRNKAGVFEEVKASVEDGYYVFETDYLGTISIVGDKDEEVVDPVEPTPKPEPTPDPEPEPTPEPTPTPDTPTPEPETPTKPNQNQTTPTPKPTVQGTYFSMGGALTGDSTEMFGLVAFAISSFLLVIFVVKKAFDKEEQ